MARRGDGGGTGAAASAAQPRCGRHDQQPGECGERQPGVRTILHIDAAAAFAIAPMGPNRPPETMARSRFRKAGQAEVMGKSEPGRQPNARRIRIELPRMDGEDGGAPGTIQPIDRVQDPARRAHAQSPSPSERHHLPESIGDERRHFENRPGRRAAHVRMPRIAHDPTIFSGAMLASTVNPSSTSVSSAHSDRSLTDHSGARKQRTPQRRPRSTRRRWRADPV